MSLSSAIAAASKRHVTLHSHHSAAAAFAARHSRLGNTGSTSEWNGRCSAGAMLLSMNRKPGSGTCESGVGNPVPTSPGEAAAERDGEAGGTTMITVNTRMGWYQPPTARTRLVRARAAEVAMPKAVPSSTTAIAHSCA